MDGLCGTSHGRRLAIACAFALTLLAFALLAGGGGAPARWHAELEVEAPNIYSPIGAVSSALPLTYHSGPVMHTNTTYAIYWVPAGSSVSANYRSIIDTYFQNVAADSGKTTNLYATSAEYSDGGGPAAYSSTWGGSVVDTQAFPASGCTNTNPQTHAPFGRCLTDAQITTEIDRVVSAQGWPRGMSTLYFMFTPNNVGTCFDSSGTTCFASY